MKQTILTKTAIAVPLTVLLLITTAAIIWKSVHHEPVRRYAQPKTSGCNDSVFQAESLDILVINGTEYLISASPIFGLPDAPDLFTFKDGYISVLFSTSQYRDKDYIITWLLRQGTLNISGISFLHTPQEIAKRYPDREAYLEPIARANRKFWQKQYPDSIPPDPDAWKYDAFLHATWYTGTLYAKKIKYGFADSTLVVGVLKEGYPVLKLEFQHGNLKKQEELWQVRKKNNLPPPPNPFENDTSTTLNAQ